MSLSPEIPEKLYFKIGEVAELAGVEPYVLRYWETEFKEIHPVKSRSKQRLYRKKDIETVLRIKGLLYEEGFTIEGARKKIREGSPEKGEAQIPIPLDNGRDIRFLKELKRDLEELLKILKG